MSRRKLYKWVPRIIRREVLNLKTRIVQDVKIKVGASGGVHNRYEGNNLVNTGAVIKYSSIGYASYISGYCTLLNVNIGRYCSIGQYVTNAFSLHPSKDWVSIHPAFYSANPEIGFSFTEENKFDEIEYLNKENKVRNEIGNDVWIGSYVKIMPGVRIGNGAIIATGSVVTKDVEPYSIVGGVPATIIRYRFDEDDIEWLKKFKWWDKEERWIKHNAYKFENIKLLKESDF